MILTAQIGQLQDWFIRSQFNADARVDFYESVGTLLENGKSLLESLKTMHASASDEGKKPNQPAAVVMYDCLTGLRDGQSFSAAIARWVPPHESSLIAAGEAAGSVEAACAQACQTINDQRGLVGAVVKALAYPAFLILALCGVLALIGYGIVPDLLKEGPVEAWKGTTYVMIRTGLAVRAVGPYALALLVVFLTAVAVSLPRLTGRLRDRIDSIAPWSIYRVLMGTSFLLNIGTMLTAGVALQDCMLVMMRHANPYLHERLSDALRGIRVGKTLGEALKDAEHNFPNARAVRYLVDLSGEHGFSLVVQRFARRELDRSIRQITKNSKVLGIVLTLLVAGACALFILGTMGIAQAGRASFGH